MWAIRCAAATRHDQPAAGRRRRAGGMPSSPAGAPRVADRARPRWRRRASVPATSQCEDGDDRRGDGCRERGGDAARGRSGRASARAGSRGRAATAASRSRAGRAGCRRARGSRPGRGATSSAGPSTASRAASVAPRVVTAPARALGAGGWTARRRAGRQDAAGEQPRAGRGPGGRARSPARTSRSRRCGGPPRQLEMLVRVVDERLDVAGAGPPGPACRSAPGSRSDRATAWGRRGRRTRPAAAALLGEELAQRLVEGRRPDDVGRRRDDDPLERRELGAVDWR